MRAMAREAVCAAIPLAFSFIPVAGMLWISAPELPPPGVSLVRIAIALAAVVIPGVPVLLRRRSALIASNALGLPLLVLGLYPAAHSATSALVRNEAILAWTLCRPVRRLRLDRAPAVGRGRGNPSRRPPHDCRRRVPRVHRLAPVRTATSVLGPHLPAVEGGHEPPLDAVLPPDRPDRSETGCRPFSCSTAWRAVRRSAAGVRSGAWRRARRFPSAGVRVRREQPGELRADAALARIDAQRRLSG